MANDPEIEALFQPAPPGESQARRMRIMAGVTFGAWMPQLLRNLPAIPAASLSRCLTITIVSLFNSLVGVLGCVVFWRRRRFRPNAPLFIVGHWRSGTTLLHELLALDPANTWPRGIDCFAPTHAGLTERLIRPIANRLAPDVRPMDTMRFSLDLPQEDEFAALMLGLPSSARSLVFPQGFAGQTQMIDWGSASPRQAKRIARVMSGFLGMVASRHKEKRLVLKSPAHMARLTFLKRLFPDMKVIHIVRDPRDTIPSTIKMVHILQDRSALVPRDPAIGLTDAFRLYQWIFDRFEEQKGVFDSASLIEVRYEDLIARPADTLRAIYAGLGIGSPEAWLEKAVSRMAKDRPPAAAKALTQAQETALRRYAGATMERYGYS